MLYLGAFLLSSLGLFLVYNVFDFGYRLNLGYATAYMVIFMPIIFLLTFIMYSLGIMTF